MDLNLKAGIVKNSNNEDISPITSSKTVYGDNGKTVFNQLNDLESNVLTKTNTTSYTPTNNYHPATKKYVDDSSVGKTYDSNKGIVLNYDDSTNDLPGGKQIASGIASITSGKTSKSIGDYSLSGGLCTIASGDNCISYGSGCIADNRNKVLFISKIVVTSFNMSDRNSSEMDIYIDTSYKYQSSTDVANILNKLGYGDKIYFSQSSGEDQTPFPSEYTVSSVNTSSKIITVTGMAMGMEGEEIMQHIKYVACGISYTNSDINSIALGKDTLSYGIGSFSSGYNTKATGDYSEANGYICEATGDYSKAGGYKSIASGNCSKAYGFNCIAGGNYSHAEGYNTIANGSYSHAGGNYSYAGGDHGSFSHGNGCIADSQDTVLFVSSYSGSTITIDTSGKKLSTSKTAEILAKFKVGQEILILDTYFANNQINTKRIIKSIDTGNSTITVDKDLPSSNFTCYCIINPSIKNISNYYPSIAFGTGCISIGNYSSFAEGYYSTATGHYSHAEGSNTIASGSYSHAEGIGTIASGAYSHAEGYRTTASGSNSHAEGVNTTASGSYSHAEGHYTTASGNFSHAEGANTTASGTYSHAEVYYSTASGNFSHAGGYYTTADKNHMTAIGKFNKVGVDSYFSIGKGTSSSATSNAFRVSSTGAVYGTGAYNSSGADGAEMVEWNDGNVNKEDRVGLFVEWVGNKIQIANSYSRRLAGVISSNPSFIGNSYDDQWQGMYLKDEFERIIYEEVTIPAEYHEINGETVEISSERKEIQPKLNPEYNQDEQYIPRSERPEYGCVGMWGQILLKSDGTCNVGDFCIPTTGGIATKSEDESRGFLVLEVRENNIIKIHLSNF